jgi:hypothetical protein
LGIVLSYIIAIRNGGDWMPHFRLLSQYTVLYALLCLWLGSPEVALRPRVFRATAMLCIAFTLAQTSLAILMKRQINEPDGFTAFYNDVGDRLVGVLRPQDVISAEGIGKVAYRFPNTSFHDPTGLMDAHIARYGKNANFYGKEDAGYSIGVVRPAILLWHFAGHLRGVDSRLFDAYEAFCHSNCDSNWNMRIIMIRKDRAVNLAPPFREWPSVQITPNRIAIAD